MNSLLTITATMARLGICRNTVAAMIRDGRLTAVNLNPGGLRPTWRIDPDSLPAPELSAPALTAAADLRRLERRLGV